MTLAHTLPSDETVPAQPEPFDQIGRSVFLYEKNLPTLATRWKELLRLARPEDAAKSSAYSYLQGTFDTAARGDFEELMDSGMLLIGSPETCIRQIKRHREFLGDALQYMILFFAYGNLTQKQVLNSMRLFAQEVMPEFADAPVSTPSKVRTTPAYTLRQALDGRDS